MDYSKMSDEELIAAYNKQSGGGSAKSDYSKMSDEELIAAYNKQSGVADNTKSDNGDWRTLSEKAFSFDTSPEIAGMAGGAGDLYAREGLLGLAKTYGKALVKGGGNIFSTYMSARDDLNKTGVVDEAKAERRQMEDQAAERSPGKAATTQLAAAILTAPAAAVKGATFGKRMIEAGKIGAAMGGGHAIGRADSGAEAAADVLLGTGMNMLLRGSTEGLGKLSSGTMKIAKNASKYLDKGIDDILDDVGGADNEVKTQVVKDLLTLGKSMMKKSLGASAAGYVGYELGGPQGAAIAAGLASPRGRAIAGKVAGKAFEKSGASFLTNAAAPYVEPTLRTLGTGAMLRKRDKLQGE